MLSSTVLSATEHGFAYIACLDDGKGREQPVAAPRRFIFEQDGVPFEDRHCYPHEVIGLGAHSHDPGHEREFVIATLLFVGAVRAGHGRRTGPPGAFHRRAGDYDALPPRWRDDIIGACLAAGC